MPAAKSDYAEVNGVRMYYEVHGEGGTPLVLLHGAVSAIPTSFGKFLPGLAEGRQVIAVEFQAHGRTADIDRPLTVEALAGDIIAFLEQQHLGPVDLFGYSMGAGVAFEVAAQRPDLVRKVVAASVSYNADGLHPGLLAGLDMVTADMMVGSPFHDEYLRLAPNPDDHPKQVEQMKHMNRSIKDWPAERVQALEPPILVIIGDSDIVTPEHAVELFRLLGGGVIGDQVGLPKSQLAILPGTTHVTVAYRDDLIVPMVTAFLDA
jgi:pimeloyl-ACP methyl ester carboxylesterase